MTAYLCSDCGYSKGPRKIPKVETGKVEGMDETVVWQIMHSQYRSRTVILALGEGLPQALVSYALPLPVREWRCIAAPA